MQYLISSDALVNGVPRHATPVSGRQFSRITRVGSRVSAKYIAEQLRGGHWVLTDLLDVQIAQLLDMDPASLSKLLGHSDLRGPHAATLDRLVARHLEAVLAAPAGATVPANGNGHEAV
jgi:hypothetical protein